MTENKPHHGRNIKRFREWAGIKQEALATELNWSQQKVSLLEQKEEVDDAILDEVASILKMPKEVIQNYTDDQPIFNIQNNYEGSTLNHSSNYQYNYQPTFNPLDKLMEQMEENKRLYERLLQEKEAMIEELKKIMK